MVNRATTSTIPLSARFDQQEFEVLKRAAEKKQWSVAQLVRAGAYEKAVQIVNATGGARSGVETVVSRVVAQLQRPDYDCYDLTGETRDPETGEDIPFGDTEEYYKLRVVPRAVSPEDFFRFVRVIRALGPELADLLEEVYRKSTGGESLEQKLNALLLPSQQSTGDAASSESAAGDGTSSSDSADQAAHRAKERRKAVGKEPRAAQRKRVR